ncbi:hypothetical protein HYY71_02930 [Candidatus Woesearchaeota archaeon]|nr:hypothetical protein [Candidatus Woesearchaeota archaeon]
MEAAHSLGILSIKKNVNENTGFFLANKKGGYCSFFSRVSSRYHGFFYFDERIMRMYRFIENIEVPGNSDVSSLKNGFYFAERKKTNAVESFMMPKGFNSLIYELTGANQIDVFLDCKNSYDNREWGRHYDIFEEKGCIIAKFTKKTDKREDSTDGIEEFSMYMAIKSDKNSYSKNNAWVERHYSYDEERNSKPFKRYVYNALRLQGSKFVFSVSRNKNDAIKECSYVFSNLEQIKNAEKNSFFSILSKESAKKILKNSRISNEVKIAYVCALNALDKLIVDDKPNYGVFAGMPWFFQFWARDSLISLKALSGIDDEMYKKILFQYLNRITNDGRLANLAGSHEFVKLGNADAHGWLFLRCRELVDSINKNKEIINSIKKSMIDIKQNKNYNFPKIKEYLKKCSLAIAKKEDSYHKILYEIESSLEKSLNGLLKCHAKDGFESNEKLETWMDTEFENDKREGFRIEIQALRLSMYRLVHELTFNHKYKAIENILRNNVKEKFWNGKILADGLNDFTIRPNIFIAAYAYPELLSSREWETCFENVLKNIWLEWGGLSTIDRKSPLFAENSTGEDVKSYHRGDSWFWVNNLAALVLNRINKIKFNNKIKKIVDASAEEILWKGCIGCHSEISSANKLESNGCFNQAWSNAMYIEMVEEIFS